MNKEKFCCCGRGKREGRNVSAQKHVYIMQCFKISEPQAQLPPPYLYHAHKARQTAETSSEQVWFPRANTSLSTLQRSEKEQEQYCCKNMQAAALGVAGAVCTHSTAAKPGKCACTRQGLQSAIQKEGAEHCPPALQDRQQVLGRSCCKHLCSALENNSPWLVPRSAQLIRHRGFLEGRYKREQQEERKHSIYQHLTCTSRDCSTKAPARSTTGNCPQY